METRAFPQRTRKVTSADFQATGIPLVLRSPGAMAVGLDPHPYPSGVFGVTTTRKWSKIRPASPNVWAPRAGD